MAVGEFPLPELKPITGVRLGCAFADIKGQNPAVITRDDVMVMAIDSGANVAGVFTQNAFCAAPVTLCKQYLGGEIRALVVNSGNANACTGEQGMNDAQSVCQAVASELETPANSVMPFSTGVIGQPLPVASFLAAIPKACANLAEEGWSKAARAIMTTDTRPKGASVSVEIDGKPVTVTGIVKGSGMIEPNMATLLAYVATDAAVAQPILQQILQHACDQSLNRVTIDGDTSTNDSCILIATGKSQAQAINQDSGEHFEQLRAAVTDVLQQLARAIVADAEGATKFVTITVEQGESEKECLRVAYAVANSPLVKTALFASDPNWGRIVAAIGYAGVKGLVAEQVNVYLGDVQIVAQGGRAASYTEQAGQAVMDESYITIRIELGRGSATETVWTSDLSHEYVTINAEYRT